MRHKKGGEASISRIFSEDDVYFMENFGDSTHRRSISTTRSPPAHPDVKFDVSPRRIPLGPARDSDRAVKPERRRFAESPRFPSGQAYTVPPLNLDKYVWGFGHYRTRRVAVDAKSARGTSSRRDGLRRNSASPSAFPERKLSVKVDRPSLAVPSLPVGLPHLPLPLTLSQSPRPQQRHKSQCFERQKLWRSKSPVGEYTRQAKPADFSGEK